MLSDSWLARWNYSFFTLLFHFVPHTAWMDELCKILLTTPLLTTWVFAACFCVLWQSSDGNTAERRSYLLSNVFALLIAVIVTLIPRPWVHWPAPVLNPVFQPLFPHELWGNGSENCFPSHSTLVYLTMAIGFWPLNRRLSIWLCAVTVLFISFPRIYVGGHYAVDVLVSCLLAIAFTLATRRHRFRILEATNSFSKLFSPTIRELFFFLCLFELGEAFHSAESLVGLVHHAIWS